MKVAGRVWLIRLTRLGVRALKDVVVVTDEGTFEAYVLDEDDRGIWASPVEFDSGGKGPSVTTLLKWEYIATMQAVEQAGPKMIE
ncbi:MAG TPA: hypothetical protein VEF54_02915 [archaeon]|nr:hypothetical protein [archaeon]